MQLNRLASQVFVEITFPTALHFHKFVPDLGHRRAGRAQVPEGTGQGPRAPKEAHARLSGRLQAPRLPQLLPLTFNRGNVFLETDPIEGITANSIRTAEGAEHEIDVLIFATGFSAFEAGNMPPYPVRGAGGVDLESWWDENRFQAYQGVSVPGFPNLFTILGPYGYNGSSYFNLIENQSKHILR